MKYLLLLLIPFMISCSERYRYPCQDPRNWGEEYCKKPFCTANGTCPEDLTHYEKDKSDRNQSVSKQNVSPGSCK